MDDKNQTPKTKINQPFHDVGKRLKEIRESLKKTQADMSADLGVSLPMLQNYEAGKHLISSAGIMALVKRGFNANWILSERGEMEIADTPVTEPTLNYKALKFIVKTIETEIQTNEVNLSPSGIAQIVAVSYDAFITSGGDFSILSDKIKTQIQIFDLGEE